MRPRTPLRAVGRRLSGMLDFLRSESAGGALLIVMSFVALVWSNSGIAPSYHHLLELPVGLSSLGVVQPVHVLVNDGLMAVFFLLVALEIRHEMTEGQLATLRGIAAPAIAALGGMVAPALIYLALNGSDPAAAHGWAVPVATDIAFSLAVIRVLGPRVPLTLIVFLTALAILDDLGAIIVIAVFYTQHISWLALLGAVAAWVALFCLNRAGVRTLWPYLFGGLVLWLLVFNSGIHATLAGVALAFVIPSGRKAPDESAPADRLERMLESGVAWCVLPVFGLANAGLELNASDFGILNEPAPLGIMLALFFGKQIGVFGATWTAKSVGFVTLPGQFGMGSLYGASLLCGIGFTMSLFIAELSFHGSELHDKIKLAVFLASIVSAAAGLLVLSITTRRRHET